MHDERSPDQKLIEQQTRHWLKDIVIGHDFCPFAKRELLANRVRFCVLSGNAKAKFLEQIIDEMLLLEQRADIETTLLIFADSLRGFNEYLDFLELAQTLMEEQSMEGIYQLASFHPAYQFADSAYDDPANFTNRSPYPIIHILREASVERAVQNYPYIDAVPQRNIELARAKGMPYWEELLSRITADE